jgi:hypothetical protein
VETVDAGILADSRNRQPLSEAATEIAFLIVQRAIAERNMARMAEMSSMDPCGIGPRRFQA